MKSRVVQKNFEVVVVGGGVTGAALGYGLAKSGCRVAVVDATPAVDRASRSNMGLIWCQSKALGNPAYVHWGFASSRLFGALAAELAEISGIDIAYSASGGIIPCLGENEFNQRSQYMEDLRIEAGGKYPGTMLERAELEKLLPRIRFGDRVVGGTWCPEDGFVEPLKLVFALRKGMANLGGTLLSDCQVTHIQSTGGGYRLKTAKGNLACARLVLAGGLGNRQLMAYFGQKVPLTPDRGQVLLTERVGDILPIPMLGITRTPGGTVMIGFMHENVGTDIGFVPESVAKEARWALSVWPSLADLRVIRCWSSLRVMPLDGFPIYDRIPGHERAFVINAHSAVTLAAVHVKELPGFILGRPLPDDAAGFGLSRFNRD
jgi:glycine/D-amino acid oxidase-like deaminating enzyme